MKEKTLEVGFKQCMLVFRSEKIKSVNIDTSFPKHFSLKVTIQRCIAIKITKAIQQIV